ncbi:MAG: PBP1A family penicillin-binding protein [Elusimicrobiales bacterium]
MLLEIWRDKYRRWLYLGALAVVACSVCAAAGLRYVFSGLPSTVGLEEYTPSLTTRVFDANGKSIAEFSMQRRALIPLAQIPVDLQNAVIATEDTNFFHHYGISPKGILRSLLRDVLHRRAAQGASTITQQLARQIFLTPEKTILRKIREVIITFQIESRFSKEEILQMYLNQIYFGESAHGASAAARVYFNKEVSQLTLPESALLAGLIQLPGRYSPFSSPARAKWRRSVVLERMEEEGYITEKERTSAKNAPLPVEKPAFLATHAPYFVEYVRQYLEPKYGVNMLWQGGLYIYTTLDLDAQLVAEKVMDKDLSAIDADVAKTIAKAEQSGDYEADVSTSGMKLQGAFLMMDVKSGAIRVMIGGRDYKETKFNRTAQSNRQPGSTFKPFVWMTALQNGYTPASMVPDSPLAYYYDGRDWRLFEGATSQYSIALATQPFVGSKDFKIWVPENFDHKMLGDITLRKGLELSRNVVSVGLVDKLGPTLVAETARKAGIRRKLDPVPSLGLGTSAVSLLEMVNSFSTFANGGIRTEPYAVVRVEDQQRRVLEEHIPSETEVFPPNYSYVLVNMMRGVVDRGTGRAAHVLNRPLAGKTGTSQDHRDMWFIGMTPDVAAGAWMGYDDFSSIESKDWTGGGTVVPWWTEIMGGLLKNQPPRPFPVPDGVTFALIDSDSGKLALPTCRRKFLEAFVKGTEPKAFCEIDHDAN